MWTCKLGSGLGGLPPNNSHSFEIAENVKEYGEFFGIDFNAHRPSDKLSWKLEDANGCQHNLPFFFKAGELSKFNIIVDGSAVVGEYHFTCSLRIWPKEFPAPIPKFYSLTTVQIRGPELRRFNDGIKYSQSTPSLRRRRKGEEEWKDSFFMITFSGCEIFEVQFYTPLPNGTMIYSPIVEVSCMWREFDFERDWQLDLEEMNLHRKLSFVYDKDKFYKTKCTIMLKKIDTTASDDNKEVSVGWLDSDRVKMEQISLVPGAQYELKMNISSTNISFIRIFCVPDDYPIDNALWTNLFGAVDHVTFSCEESLTRCSLKSALAPVGTVDDMKSEKRHLTLYKHGYFHYKSTLHWQPQPYHPLENFNFSGTFILFRDEKSVLIKLSKLFKSKIFTKPNISLLPSDPTNEGTITEPFLIPELLDRIISYESDIMKLTCRLVCKSWCLALDPAAISGTATSKSITLLDYVHNISK